MSLPTPSIEYGLLSPLLIVFGVAVAGVLVEALLPRAARYRAQLVLALGGLAAALVAVVVLGRHLAGTGRVAVLGAVAVDAPALFLQGTILLVGLLGVLLIAERRIPAAEDPDGGAGGLDAFTPQAPAVPGSVAEKTAARAGITQTEVFPLTMFATGGMLLFPAADDLLAMFIALEVLSLPLYLLCGLARRRRLLSQEAALKYFLLGAFSSAFFLYGMALLYGYSGTFSLTGIAAAVESGTDTRNASLALIGMGLLAVGVLFKVGAVPFHSWIPDVYQGAPTPITGYMAAATKIAAFGAMLRIFYVGLPGLHVEWRPVLWAVAIATMVVGTVTAVSQNDVKRMLAYSAVAHAGFILTGVIALTDSGVSATLFYLFAYGFSTLGAFAVVSLVRDRSGHEDTELAHWAGLGRRYPVVGVVFSLFLLAFAGIPLTSGFVSKFAVFKAAGEGGAIPLVIVGVIASAVAAYFYVRVIVLMFFTDPPEDAPEVVTPSWTSTATVTLTAAITLALGALPQPLLDLANESTQFVR
ncbi:NADH-quinone oxidoreductase subunit NuoN [Mycolicibacterium palauense]|uniref:NADH-quinone oxidoreductase subunit NuoN n=1 Tax=Mycolicibacterium palauense TaxID=2034511 RepID=UPI000BFEF680|nr:NADH-quinone oxidoreductase subunit NuoN [Mycolicibacterium palauense]